MHGARPLGRALNPPEEVMTSGPGTIIIYQVYGCTLCKQMLRLGAGSSPQGNCCGGSIPPGSCGARAFACVRLVRPFDGPPSCEEWSLDSTTQ